MQQPLCQHVSLNHHVNVCLAILTNNFVPCNGRWPMLILMASLFMAAGYTGSMQTLVTAGVVVGMVVLGVIMTLTCFLGTIKNSLKRGSNSLHT